jgi:predicted RNase H-like nuclease
VVRLQVDEVSPWTPEQISITVNSMRLRQHLGMPEFVSAIQAADHAYACLSLYALWLPVVKSGAITDLGVGEDVVDMAVCAFMAAYAHDADMAYVLQVRQPNSWGRAIGALA